jgi:hypothetical protein
MVAHGSGKVGTKSNVMVVRPARDRRGRPVGWKTSENLPRRARAACAPARPGRRLWASGLRGRGSRPVSSGSGRPGAQGRRRPRNSKWAGLMGDARSRSASPRCGGRLRVLGAVEDPVAIGRFLPPCARPSQSVPTRRPAHPLWRTDFLGLIPRDMASPEPAPYRDAGRSRLYPPAPLSASPPGAENELMSTVPPRTGFMSTILHSATVRFNSHGRRPPLIQLQATGGRRYSQGTGVPTCPSITGVRAGPRSGRSACLGAHRPYSPRGSGCRHTRGHPATRRPLRTAS